MAADPQVLIVADPNDELACHLHEAMSHRGWRCAFLDGPSAARLFTIQVDADGAHVVPDVPLFMRASAWWDDQATSDDERFLRAEAFATLWAAAALCKSPVINRPTPAGSVGRLTISAIASKTGACAGSANRELYVSDPAIALGHIDPPIWGEDIDFRTRELSALRANVPARVRSVMLDAGYEIIPIVGARAFATTTDERTQRAGMLARCIEIVASFELHFATVTWMLGADGATPVRLNAEPSTAELHTCLDAVIEGLCQDLHP